MDGDPCGGRRQEDGGRLVIPQSLRKEVMEVLNGIVDPCSAATALPAGIVDMGMIRDVTFHQGEGGAVECSVTLCITHALCMMTGIFVQEIQQRLQSDARISDVRVLLDRDTVWTEELMSPQYRARLEHWRSTKGG